MCTAGGHFCVSGEMKGGVAQGHRAGPQHGACLITSVCVLCTEFRFRGEDNRHVSARPEGLQIQMLYYSWIARGSRTRHTCVRRWVFTLAPTDVKSHMMYTHVGKAQTQRDSRDRFSTARNYSILCWRYEKCVGLVSDIPLFFDVCGNFCHY